MIKALRNRAFSFVIRKGFVFSPLRRVYKRRYKKRYKNMLLFWGFMLVKKVFVFFGKKQFRNPI